MMEKRHCLRCGKKLPAGALTYVVHIRVFSGFDGLLLEPEEGIDQHLNEVLEQVRKSDPKDLEKEVYEEFTLLLCKSCRDRFVEETRHPWEGSFWVPKDPDRIKH
jgi:hypothetical protein